MIVNTVPPVADEPVISVPVPSNVSVIASFVTASVRPDAALFTTSVKTFEAWPSAPASDTSVVNRDDPASVAKPMAPAAAAALVSSLLAAPALVLHRARNAEQLVQHKRRARRHNVDRRAVILELDQRAQVDRVGRRVAVAIGQHNLQIDDPRPA